MIRSLRATLIAFVLRYRVRHTCEGDEEMRRFTVDLDVRTRGTPWSAGRCAIIGEEADHAATLGMADGRQWSATSGTMPGNWKDPRRIGMVGFSAGGAVTMAAATGLDAYERPDFAALIYSPQADTMTVPPDAPPLFLACAIDDPNVSATESIATWQAGTGLVVPPSCTSSPPAATASAPPAPVTGPTPGSTCTGPGCVAWASNRTKLDLPRDCGVRERPSPRSLAGGCARRGT